MGWEWKRREEEEADYKGLNVERSFFDKGGLIVHAIEAVEFSFD